MQKSIVWFIFAVNKTINKMKKLRGGSVAGRKQKKTRPKTTNLILRVNKAMLADLKAHYKRTTANGKQVSDVNRMTADWLQAMWLVIPK